MKQLQLLLIFISLHLGTQAQTGTAVFNDTILHQLFIETDLPHWFDTLERDYKLNVSYPLLYPEVYRPCKVTWDGTTVTGCGFREKGNSSNSLMTVGKKKPYKISFDEFETQKLDGLKKINLNNFINDPSLLHDALSYKAMRDEGIIAPRTSFTKLWVNGEYIGLYIVIENVDKTFLKDNFGIANSNGNLYKTDRGASVPLKWLGDSAEPYKKQKLKLTTNENTDDWSKLIEFIRFLNLDSSADFQQKFEANFDIHAYLKILALEKCLRSFDSYWGGGNNFYVYEHPDGKIRWIPWDMNETFQDIKKLSSTSILDGYLVPANKFDERPLLKRIFEIDDYKTEYFNTVCNLIHSSFSLEKVGAYAVKLHNLIDEAYRIDPYKHNTYDAFKKSLTSEHIDNLTFSHSAYVIRLRYPGLFPFIQSQRHWATEQLKAWDYSCYLEEPKKYSLTIFPNPANSVVNISNNNANFDYANFTLYDFTGKVVFRTNYESMGGAYYTLPLNSIKGGIYMLTKQSSNGDFGKAKLIID